MVLGWAHVVCHRVPLWVIRRRRHNDILLVSRIHTPYGALRLIIGPPDHTLELTLPIILQIRLEPGLGYLRLIVCSDRRAKFLLDVPDVLLDVGLFGRGHCRGVFGSYDGRQIPLNGLAGEDTFGLGAAGGQLILEDVVDALQQELGYHLPVC